ncbi:sulfatase-like hydrolase/transferase [Thalassotalea nanhaiensis]|uniref:Sulfatase-like hydrolase/transferase n=1 Tax=Thalassotalea nanhaiensis TaxID=3065648 RepID=A0ABY9TK10_9GAMM|nr:sulfatase-like hydrolase/transferase [Colwelliaceae bacterium SQ345]
MISNKFIKGAALSLFAVVIGMSPAIAADEKPNFIIILADDLGYGDVGYTGSTEIKTPHIDALAKSGVIFEQGYVSAPVCGPSRAGLMTGRNQVNFGFDNNNVKPGPQYNREYFGLPITEKTIADRLAKQGYVNGMIGKWHLGDEAHFKAPKRGFDEVWTYPVGGHDYFRSEPNGEGYLSPLESNFKTPDPITYITDDTGNESAAFIKRNKNKPFFLYASFNAPHAPLQAPQKDIDLYKHIKNENRRIYAAMIHRLDENVGKIVAELKANNVYDNTVIVFLSDNGGPGTGKKSRTVNAPFRGSKGILLEGGIHVPFIMSWPNGLKANSRYEHPITTLDLTPTFVALAGGEILPKDKIDGVNVYPYLTGENTGNPNQQMKWRFTVSASIRDGDWKLIRLPDRLPLLYNVKEDVAELNDVAAKHPERVVKMLKTLGTWDISTPQHLYMEGARYKKEQLKSYDAQYRITQPK